jgi:glycine/D-amino acid oxidase-like deaminating enzyme/nitrite reductase/ring-hydroxylating ferredoxin subunit
MPSLWLDPPIDSDTEPLVPGSRHDVVVVGAGLTGLATALLLAEAGRDVLVLEGDEVGHGTTGHTTAKVSLLQGTRLSSVREHATDAELRAYVAGNRAGQEWLLGFLRGAGATVETRDAWTYAVSARGRESLTKERDAARAAGLAVEECGDTELPFTVSGALRLPDQAQIHAGELLRVLAERVQAAGGRLVTGARVTGVSATLPPTLSVEVGGEEHGDEQAQVSAEHVVLATGTPIVDRGLHFARLEPQRSYVLAFRFPGPIPQGMYLSADQPSRSLRTVTADGEVLLLVGGEGHVVGRGGSTQARVDRLVAWTQQHFPGAEPTSYQWSAQDYRSTCRLPLVGSLPGSSGDVLVATGFAKWGMTNASAAALTLSGLLAGEVPAWSKELYRHTEGLADLVDAARLNVAVAAHLGTGWGTGLARSLPAEPPADGKGVVGRRLVDRSGAGPVAVSTADGRTCAVSAVCTHLGGIVSWNDAERTWDCPLHGSRFAADGRRIEGPAVRDLAPAEGTAATGRDPAPQP